MLSFGFLPDYLQRAKFFSKDCRRIQSLKVVYCLACIQRLVLITLSSIESSSIVLIVFLSVCFTFLCLSFCRELANKRTYTVYISLNTKLRLYECTRQRSCHTGQILGLYEKDGQQENSSLLYDIRAVNCGHQVVRPCQDHCSRLPPESRRTRNSVLMLLIASFLHQAGDAHHLADHVERGWNRRRKSWGNLSALLSSRPWIGHFRGRYNIGWSCVAVDEWRI